MRVVIVESPAKAKTLGRYFGSSSTVLPSYGHVRDLAPKDGSVDPEHDFAMRWQLTGGADKNLSQIKKALKNADQLLLATDPDREGEAISWHILHWLRENTDLSGKDVRRIVFHEITRSAVEKALDRPRAIDDHMVDAYMARRALDYLVGFTLSPLLWRKLPGSRSAGRVQSVALRAICDREDEIDAFKPRDYWTMGADFRHGSDVFRANLEMFDGKDVDKFFFTDQAQVDAAGKALAAAAYRAGKRETRESQRAPYAPFTTSTMQQTAFNRLGFSAARTMRAAQRLYEGDGDGGGLITYMRTDSNTLSVDALKGIRDHIGKNFPPDYKPASPRVYKTKVRNAQEAHEAIRPTDINRLPGAVKMDGDEARLYDLIWRRALASQMASARRRHVALEIDEGTGQHRWRAVGSQLIFDGFIRVWGGEDDAATPVSLPDIAKGTALDVGDVIGQHHVTQPPPRYSEATLIKRLEELGIGRPSTYAAIVSVLKERQYVQVEKKRFVPDERGRIVTTFLVNFFRRYVEYEFTAGMEDQLDEISKGDLARIDMLRDFWKPFSNQIAETSKLSLREVIDLLNEKMESYIFRGDHADAATEDMRQCPTCGKGRLSMRLGRYGPFIGCSDYPDCRYTRPLGGEAKDQNGTVSEPRSLGDHPDGGTISIRSGPYGLYIQWDKEAAPKSPTKPTTKPPAPKSTTKQDAAKSPPKQDAAKAGKGKKTKKADKPQRVSLPPGENPDGIDKARALEYLKLPRQITLCPETGKPIVAGIGRYGPYVGCDGIYASLRGEDTVFVIGANRAVDLIAAARIKKAQNPKRARGKAKPKTTKAKTTKAKTTRKPAAKKSKPGP